MLIVVEKIKYAFIVDACTNSWPQKVEFYVANREVFPSEYCNEIGMWILSVHIYISFFSKISFVILLSSWILTATAALPRPKLYGKAIAHRDLDTRYANTKKRK
ncbi:hypothetical protein CEXT_757081 [Caerostris extrusa]|uniref:Uncharacterized protein n=1 Tax=Caerostris extrusa TaxID=172846 RepID=A0AAV4V469_CAEEX|nr:hypothetical protein CEXT_757081 [Caerostris extrusa]